MSLSKQPFPQKIIPAKIFGKQFLEVEEKEILDEGNYDLINQVKEFILRNIDKENLTIDEIASELYMSRTLSLINGKH